MPIGRMRVLAQDAAILRRREMEDRLNNARSFVQEQQKMTSMAEWELKSSTRCSWLNQARSEEQKEAVRMADLERRRALLAEKLQREEEQLKKEALEKQEAIASRRSQLVDKAQQRAAEREAERRKLAEQLMELQFRETCDALRSKQSQQRLVGIAEQQKQQVAEQQKRQQADSAADLAFDRQAMSEDARQVTEYENSLAQSRRKYLEIKGQLDSQVAAHRQQAAEAAAAHRQEVATMHTEWQRLEDAAKTSDRQESLHKQELLRETEELNRVKQAETAARREAERQAESARLQAALQRDTEANTADRAAKAQRREADQQYRAHLEASLLREEDDMSARDSLIEQANKVQQAKEDARRAAADAARAKLMREVTSDREHQLQNQALSREEMRGERQAELERLQQLALEAAVEEEEEATRLRREEIRYRMELQAQIAAKQQRLALQRAAEAQSVGEAAAAEKVFQQKLVTVLTSTQPQTDFRRKKVDWYS